MLGITSQTLSIADLPLLCCLIGIEVLLSTDNMAVLSLLIRNLTADKQRKALFVGILSSFVIRAVGILFVAKLIHMYWIQIVGGVYIIFISSRYAFYPPKMPIHTAKNTPFWKTVVQVEIADVMFALDSVLAAFALASLFYPTQYLIHKVWIIFLGAVIGITLVRYSATFFVKILYRYPYLEKFLFVLLAWVGTKLILDGIMMAFWPDSPCTHVIDILFGVGTILIILAGILSLFLVKRRK